MGIRTRSSRLGAGWDRATIMAGVMRRDLAGGTEVCQHQHLVYSMATLAHTEMGEQKDKLG